MSGRTGRLGIVVGVRNEVGGAKVVGDAKVVRSAKAVGEVERAREESFTVGSSLLRHAHNPTFVLWTTASLIFKSGENGTGRHEDWVSLFIGIGDGLV